MAPALAAPARPRGLFLLRMSPNRWDVVLLPLVIAALFLLAWGSGKMAQPFHPGEQIVLSLDPAELPGYAFRTTLRMAFAMVASLLFTFVYGSIAAKSDKAGRLLVPLLDILQSVPLLGFLSVAGGWFFVVAAEAISVEGYDIELPGIGSYIALAIRQKDGAAIGYAILAMLAVILLTDQLVFRP